MPLSRYDVKDRHAVFAYFGTCSRAILSMFELTLGNWPVIARILQDKVSEWYFAFSIAHKVTIGFAVIGVINGVFMQETFKVAGSDDKIMMRQRDREKKLHTKKMKRLFEHADESGDGILDMEDRTSLPHVLPMSACTTGRDVLPCGAFRQELGF
eukprot:Skav208377  [mRNA]  locus=scaffold3508:24674:26189:+ [translate_table: standard]